MDAEDGLVHRSRSGDLEAFARLVEMHQTIAHRVAASIMGSGNDADDVVQDSFVKAFTRLSQFHEGRSFRAWLLAIVANEARNRRRSAGRNTALTLRVATRPDAPAIDTTTDPTRAYEASEMRQCLAAAMATLADRDREILAMRYFADLSEAETAAALNCPIGTVKSRLSRALMHLRTAMTEEPRR